MSRVVLVTGGSRGIGRAIAEHFGTLGHRVAVNYSANAGAAEEAVKTIEASGSDAAAFQADVGVAGDVERLFDEVHERFGPIEILVNNAGITRDTLLLRMDPEAWDEVIDTNLRSVFLCSKAASRDMLRAKWGRIVNISSVSGVSGNAGQTNYSASKAGIIGFTKALAKELGSRGVTVNAVAPGFIETELTAVLGNRVTDTAVGNIAVGRLGRPEEVAAAVGYLASEEAAYVTGQTIVVDGGLAL